MRRLGLIVLLIVFSTIRLFAKDGVNIDMYGFVHNQMFMDDRKSLQAAQGLYNVIPLDIKNVSNLQFAVEYERTSVAYGTMKGHGNVVDSHWVTNNRLLFSTSYNF